MGECLGVVQICLWSGLASSKYIYIFSQRGIVWMLICREFF